jgi:hypothetical protein
MQKIKHFFFKAFYQLTAYVPRRLPETEGQWDNIRKVLGAYYGVPDTLEVWITVAGQIGATPTSQIRRSYAFLANCAKRLGTNKVIHEEKLKMIKVLKDRLETVAKEEKAKGEVSAEERPVLEAMMTGRTEPTAQTNFIQTEPVPVVKFLDNATMLSTKATPPESDKTPCLNITPSQSLSS